MGFYNYGLEKVGSFFAGNSPSPPAYADFGTGSLAIDYTQRYLNNSILRKGITWTHLNQIDVRGVTSLSANDAVGSTIQEIGMAVGSSVAGSDVYARELSSIGDKTANASYTIQFDVITRRAV